MNNVNVISLSAVREMQKAKEKGHTYDAKIMAMTKIELLEEMMSFQEERARLGRLTLNMMIRGQILFRALEESATTVELQTLTRSYRRHLKHELEAFLQQVTG